MLYQILPIFRFLIQIVNIDMFDMFEDQGDNDFEDKIQNALL